MQLQSPHPSPEPPLLPVLMMHYIVFFTSAIFQNSPVQYGVTNVNDVALFTELNRAELL